MSIKRIKKYNPPEFIFDINSVSDVMVYANNTNSYLSVTKKEVREEAETKPIDYYITDRVFKNRRKVMVIL